MFFKKDQNGLSSAIATSITGAVLLTGVAALAVGDTALKNEDDQRHGVCVTAKWADDESIFSEKCLYDEDIDSGSITPPEDNSGEEKPETEDPLVKTASYSCGPLTLNITEQDLAYSKIAEDLIKDGRGDEVVANPEGWKVITSTDSSGKKHFGLIEKDETVSILLGGYANFGDPEARKAGLDWGSEDSCHIFDDRAEPKEGNLISYLKDADWPIKHEGRYENINGKLSYTMVEEDGESNVYAVTRYKTITDENFRSDEYPSFLVVSKDDPSKVKEVTVDFIEPQDGAARVTISVNPDSSGETRYNRNNSYQPYLANRENAPSVVKWDKDGNITEVGHKVYSGDTNDYVPYSSVEEYNKMTGQNWDGKYHTPADFDLTLPFIPN